MRFIGNHTVSDKRHRSWLLQFGSACGTGDWSGCAWCGSVGRSGGHCSRLRRNTPSSVRLQGLLPTFFEVILSNNILDAYRRIKEHSTLRTISFRTTANDADGRDHSAARMNVPASAVLWILMKTPEDRLRAPASVLVCRDTRNECGIAW